MSMPSMALPVGSRSSAEEPSAVSRSNIGCGACWENVCCSAVPWLHGSATQAANKQNLRALEASCGASPVVAGRCNILLLKDKLSRACCRADLLA